MCGVLAASGRFEPRCMVALGCLSEARGSDSAGVGWVRDSDPKYLKIAQNPLVAYPVTLSPAIRGAFRAGSPIIGHTRAATTGKVTSENAHPFIEDGIVFAHNGIISNYKEFPGTYEVDSQCLIHGIKSRDFSKYKGSISLVWIQDGKLHAFRKGNPLYRGLRRKSVYLASDEDYLKEICCTKIRSLAEGHEYVWKDASLEKTEKIPYNKERSYATGYIGTGWNGDYFSECGQAYQWQKDPKTGEWTRPGETTYDYNSHKTLSLPTNCLCAEHYTCSRHEKERKEMKDEIDVLEPLCAECFQNPKIGSSNFCLECLKKNAWELRGKGGV